MSPVRRKGITRINAHPLLNGHLVTNFNKKFESKYKFVVHDNAYENGCEIAAILSGGGEYSNPVGDSFTNRQRLEEQASGLWHGKQLRP